MAKLDDLKQQATDLGISFTTKATIAELEQAIAEKVNEVNTSTDAETTAPTETTEVTETTEPEVTETTEVIEPEVIDDKPKLNNDGLVAGKMLTDEEYRAYIAKQKTKLLA